MPRLALIASFIFCANLAAQTLTQENLYEQYRKASFAKSLALVKNQEISCRYVSMLDGSFHDSDYEILIEQEGIKARSSKGAESFDLSGPLRSLSDSVYSERVESSFVGWMLGHEPAVFVYRYKVLDSYLFIAKNSKIKNPKGKNSRIIYKTNDNEGLLSLYKCDIAKQRSLASIESNDDGRAAKDKEIRTRSLKESGSSAKPN